MNGRSWLTQRSEEEVPDPGSALEQTTVLRTSPDISIRLDGEDSHLIQIGASIIRVGEHALAVLDAFRTARSFSDGIERLGSGVAGGHALADLIGTIQLLHAAGVLTDGGRSAPRVSTQEDSEMHTRLLNDRTRTSALLAGIVETVRPGDVVVDIGTGSGVLAMAAARAGARRVYAIEEGPIGGAAEETFRANGLSDRITLVVGRSDRVELPERADVLVSELIGNDPLSERLLEVTADARRRHLKRGARMVPRRLRILCQAVDFPEDETGYANSPEKNIENWRAWYGIDFTALARDGARPDRSFFANPHAARDWKAIGRPVVFADLALTASRHREIQGREVLLSVRKGRVNGLLTYFELETGPKTRFSTRPDLARADNHWLSPVYVLDEPVPVGRGTGFAIAWRRVGGRVQIQASTCGHVRNTKAK